MPLESVSFVNDLVASNPPGLDDLGEADNHLRNIKTALLATFPGMAGAAFRVQSKSSAYTVLVTDNTSLFNCKGTFTLALTAVASLGNQFIFYVYNNSRGLVTVSPNASELINGYLDYVILPDHIVTIFSDGVQFFVMDTPEQHPNAFPNSRMVYWGDGTGTVVALFSNDRPLANGMRIVLNNTGSGVIVAHKDTVVPSVLSSNSLPIFSTRFAVQTAVSSATNGTFIKFIMEGNNFIQVAQRPFTFSFWVKSSLTGNYNISMTNAGSDSTFAKHFQISAANTWEFKKIFVPASPAEGTWTYRDNTGIVARLVLAWAGATITDGEWTSISGMASTANVNFAGTLSASFHIATPLMHLGWSNRLWTPENPTQDFIDSTRVFVKTFDVDIQPASNLGAANSISWLANDVGNFRVSVEHVNMRTTPIATIYNPNTSIDGTVFTTGRTAYTSTITQNDTNRTAFVPDVVAASASNNFARAHFTFDSRFL